MPQATAKEVEFKFKNEGKSNLCYRISELPAAAQQFNREVRRVASIKPGESSSIKATFNSGGYKGKVTKTIYVHTNDPKNSEVILMLNVEVEQATGKNTATSGKII